MDTKNFRPVSPANAVNPSKTGVVGCFELGLNVWFSPTLDTNGDHSDTSDHCLRP